MVVESLSERPIFASEENEYLLPVRPPISRMALASLALGAVSAVVLLNSDLMALPVLAVSVGLAGGAEVHATLHPFILRGVSLLGASSANSPMPLRREIWGRLGGDLRVDDVERLVTSDIPLDRIPHAATDLLERRLLGRTLVTL